jgi:hypothetical protein
MCLGLGFLIGRSVWHRYIRAIQQFDVPTTPQLNLSDLLFQLLTHVLKQPFEYLFWQPLFGLGVSPRII